MSDLSPLGARTVELLGELVRNACVNDLTPASGHEHRSADTLEALFEGLPVRMRRIEPAPGRTTLVVALDGSDPAAEPLTLIGHTDVVPADDSQWAHEPFAARIDSDGVMWGRGTVDMLHLTAAMAVVTQDLARRVAEGGARPAGTLTFVAAADEEARGGLGVPWIGEAEPQAIPWRNCISEMGGGHIRGARGSDSIAVVVGEKGAAQRRLHVDGDAGHGSVPLGRHSAVEVLARVVQRLASARWPAGGGGEWEGFVSAFEFDPATRAALLAADYDGDYHEFGDLAAYTHAVSHVTVAQTVARSGGPINVMPSHATLELDIRTLPGVDDDDVDAAIAAALGDLAEHVTIERLLSEAATASSIDTDLYRVIEAALTQRYPGTRVVPVFFPGGSDLRVARRLGGIGYGFGAVDSGASLGQVYSQLHAHDEHIALADVRATAEVLHEVVTSYLTDV